MRMKKTNFGEFKIPKKRASPPKISIINYEFANVELLNLSLERDIAWILLTGALLKAIEGKHYQTGISLHKLSMNALSRIKTERNMLIDQDMKDTIVNVRLHINLDNLDKLRISISKMFHLC